MKTRNTPFYLFCCIAIFIISCENNVAKTPKPRMFPRVIYPEKTYSSFDTSICNFTFRIPNYSKIVKDSFIFEGAPTHPCWFDIEIKDLNATLHCSYYEITEKKNLSELINDAFNIAGKHNIKANYRKETVINNTSGVKGILFDIEGPVASPVQFYLTDEKMHFFRASLYFNSKVNPDSTAPVLQFLKADVDSLISTFNWKK
jgi:gliding motility-associated lipoprotein GldD